MLVEESNREQIYCNKKIIDWYLNIYDVRSENGNAVHQWSCICEFSLEKHNFLNYFSSTLQHFELPLDINKKVQLFLNIKIVNLDHAT